MSDSKVELDGEWPFDVWLNRIAAHRCRSALVRTKGNLVEAARLVGIHRHSFLRILKRDNNRIRRQMLAEGLEVQDHEVDIVLHHNQFDPSLETKLRPDHGPDADPDTASGRELHTRRGRL